MRTRTVPALCVAVVLGAASPALAQRLPFERTFDAEPGARLDVSTDRGKIDIAVGEPGKILVTGDVTVRVGWAVPADAADLARQVAAQPPIAQEGSTIRLRTPSEARARQAVTVSYRVTVPSDTEIVSSSESGATTVGGAAGHVTVRTQSGAIELSGLGGAAAVTSGSGSVTVSGVSGMLTVETSSSSVTARGLAGGLHVRTNSGSVSAELTGPGDVDVETGSSAIHVSGVRGALRASSQSGGLTLQGTPGAAWNVSAGSGSVNVTFTPGAAVALDATSRSGSVRLAGVAVEGSTARQRVVGRIAGGGPQVRIEAGSGSIRVATAKP